MQYKGQAGSAVFRRSSLLPYSQLNRSWLLQLPLAPDFGRSGVLRTPERGAELSLPTADLFGCALIRTPEQIRWSEVSTDYKSALQPAA